MRLSPLIILLLLFGFNQPTRAQKDAIFFHIQNLSRLVDNEIHNKPALASVNTWIAKYDHRKSIQSLFGPSKKRLYAIKSLKLNLSSYLKALDPKSHQSINTSVIPPLKSHEDSLLIPYHAYEIDNNKLDSILKLNLGKLFNDLNQNIRGATQDTKMKKKFLRIETTRDTIILHYGINKKELQLELQQQQLLQLSGIINVINQNIFEAISALDERSTQMAKQQQQARLREARQTLYQSIEELKVQYRRKYRKFLKK